MEISANHKKWCTWFIKNSQMTEQKHVMNSWLLMKHKIITSLTWRLECSGTTLPSWSGLGKPKSCGTWTGIHRCTVLLMSFEHKHKFCFFLITLQWCLSLKIDACFLNCTSKSCIMLSVPSPFTDDSHCVLDVRRRTNLHHFSPDGRSSLCGAKEASSRSILQIFKVLNMPWYRSKWGKMSRVKKSSLNPKPISYNVCNIRILQKCLPARNSNGYIQNLPV